ncbi:MAG TPA: hypothetical protein VGL01_04355 [Trinickia sp.]|uniref:hypothetical protein n=1 Tax=Trinickia sp. TaxID=2571163 RepID=UPI002F429047
MKPTVENFAGELRMSPQALLDVLNLANVEKGSFKDALSGDDKAQLLDYLRASRRPIVAVSTRKLTPVRPYQHKLPLSFP